MITSDDVDIVEIKNHGKSGDIVGTDKDYVAVLLEPGASYVPRSTVKKYGQEIFRALNGITTRLKTFKMPRATMNVPFSEGGIIEHSEDNTYEQHKINQDVFQALMFRAGWFRRARYILSGERRADKLVERAVDEVERWLNSRQKFWSFELGLEKAGLTDWFNGMVLGS